MERLDQLALIEDVVAWTAKFSADLAALMSSRLTGQNVAQENLEILRSVHDAGRTTYDSMLCYIAASHGLHAASEAARAAGDDEWARELHSMGQMFLKYGVSDINKMLADIASQIASTGAVVEGGKSVH